MHRYSYQEAPETSSDSGSTRGALEDPLTAHLLMCADVHERPTTPTLRIIGSTCVRTTVGLVDEARDDAEAVEN